MFNPFPIFPSCTHVKQSDRDLEVTRKEELGWPIFFCDALAPLPIVSKTQHYKKWIFNHQLPKIHNPKSNQLQCTKLYKRPTINQPMQKLFVNSNKNKIVNHERYHREYGSIVGWYVHRWWNGRTRTVVKRWSRDVSVYVGTVDATMVQFCGGSVRTWLRGVH